jgi:hypothetical protein
MLIFFAVTGSWQLFNWHESKKDWSYTAPPALAALSFVHKDAHIPSTPGGQPTPLRYFMLAAAAGLVATAVIGASWRTVSASGQWSPRFLCSRESRCRWRFSGFTSNHRIFGSEQNPRTTFFREALK